MMSFRVALPLICLALGAGGCSLIVGTAAVGTAVVVGTVGAAGYTVYKGGEAVVSTAGSVGSSAKSLVVSDGTLKAKVDHPVEPLYVSAEKVMWENGFQEIDGTRDGLVGALHATTALRERVEIRFDLIAEGKTSVTIRIGEGNLKQAEYIYEKMIARVETAGGQG